MMDMEYAQVGWGGRKNLRNTSEKTPPKSSATPLRKKKKKKKATQGREGRKPKAPAGPRDFAAARRRLEVPLQRGRVAAHGAGEVGPAPGRGDGGGPGAVQPLELGSGWVGGGLGKEPSGGLGRGWVGGLGGGGNPKP